MAKISFQIEDRGTLGYIDAALQLGKNMKVPLERSGLYLLRATDKRFQSQTSSEGIRWLDLKESTKKRRRKGKKEKYGNAILRDTGTLWKSVSLSRGDGNVFRVDNEKVEVGTNLVYRNVHQFGAKIMRVSTKGKPFVIPIPARPYLGVSDPDEERINKIFEGWFNEKLDEGNHQVRFLK